MYSVNSATIPARPAVRIVQSVSSPSYSTVRSRASQASMRVRAAAGSTLAVTCVCNVCTTYGVFSCFAGVWPVRHSGVTGGPCPCCVRSIGSNDLFPCVCNEVRKKPLSTSDSGDTMIVMLEAILVPQAKPLGYQGSRSGPIGLSHGRRRSSEWRILVCGKRIRMTT